MPGRRRQKRTDASKIDATPPWEQRIRDEPEPTTGPWDVRDLPDEDEEVTRIDLGALLVPVGEGFDLQVEVNEAQQVIAATLASPSGSMQLGVFAAPRNEGIWDDVRGEIAASLNAARKGSALEKDGPFGTELHGSVKEGNGWVPIRFVGVDGPRWFLRATFAGPAAADAARAEPFEQLLRQVVVVRGADPLPVREPVPLRLPHGVELPGGEADPA